VTVFVPVEVIACVIWTVEVDDRACVVWTDEVKVDGLTVTVVGTTIVLVEVCVPV
jgi:hypothetical protein